MLDVYTDLERFDKLGKTVSPANMPKSMFKLLNWAADEDKDFPDVDPKKIDFEEVTDYLIQKNIKVPQFGFSTDAINPKLRKDLFPEQSVIEKSSEQEDVAGVNFLQGSDIGGQTARDIVNFVPQAPTPAYQGLVDPKFLPTAPIAPVSPVTPMNQQQQFQNLFPNDPLGAAIAGQGQR